MEREFENFNNGRGEASSAEHPRKVYPSQKLSEVAFSIIMESFIRSQNFNPDCSIIFIKEFVAQLLYLLNNQNNLRHYLSKFDFVTSKRFQ